MLIVGEEAWILWIGIAEIYIKRFSRQALYTISLFIFLGDCDGICHCTTNVGIEMLCWAQHIDSICLVMKLSPQLLMVPHKSMCSTREYQNIQLYKYVFHLHVLLFYHLNGLIVFFPSACSNVQSFSWEPTLTRNIVFRGKGFPPALLSKKSCRTAISCYAAWSFFCKKFTRSKCFRLQPRIFRNAVSGEYELWFIGFQLFISFRMTFFLVSFFLNMWK